MEGRLVKWKVKIILKRKRFIKKEPLRSVSGKIIKYIRYRGKRKYYTREDWMKACALYAREYRQRNLEKCRERERKYYHSEAGKRQRERYYQKNKDKLRARRKARDLVKRGIIKKQPCMICGNPNSQMHHRDYNHPEIVEWYCRMCHAKIHIKPYPKFHIFGQNQF